MVRKNGLAKSRRVAGVCAGLVTMALVPGGQLIYNPPTTSDSGSTQASPADSASEVEPANGKAVWNGFDWILIEAPVDEVPGSADSSEYLPSEDLDIAYSTWEAMETKIAEIDLVRRLANDDRSQRNLKLRNEYNTWEAGRAAKAHDELETRLALAAEAAREVDLAAQRVEQAQAAHETATDHNREVALQEIQAAAAALESAIAINDFAQELLGRYEQRAISEASHQATSQYTAIVELGAQREAEAAAGMGVRMFAEPVEMVTTETLNLRRGPGVGYEKIGEVVVGTQVIVTGKGHDFYRLSNGGYLPAVFVASVAEELLDTGSAVNTAINSGSSGTKTAPVDPPSKYAFQSYVANVDSQEAVDACTGGLTYSPDISKILGKEYYPIHNYCGGMPILALTTGNKVNIEGVGTYTVVDTRDVVRGDTTAVLAGIKGTVLLQTCYPNSTKMRVVGLDVVVGGSK